MQGNPILNQINRRNSAMPQQTQQLQIQEVKKLMRRMEPFGNTQLMIQTLLQQHPELQQVMAIQQKGASFQQIAEIMAQQKGVNLNNLIQELQTY